MAGRETDWRCDLCSISAAGTTLEAIVFETLYQNARRQLLHGDKLASIKAAKRRNQSSSPQPSRWNVNAGFLCRAIEPQRFHLGLWDACRILYGLALSYEKMFQYLMRYSTAPEVMVDIDGAGRIADEDSYAASFIPVEASEGQDRILAAERLILKAWKFVTERKSQNRGYNL